MAPRNAPARGRCRWCYENTAGIHLSLHEYCLDVYRVASGQKPATIQLSMCESCADPAKELDHRLAVTVARALGSDTLRRAFPIENRRWLCHDCHRRKSALDRRRGTYLRSCSFDWRSACRALRLNRGWIEVFLAPLGVTDVAEGPMTRAA